MKIQISSSGAAKTEGRNSLIIKYSQFSEEGGGGDSAATVY